MMYFNPNCGDSDSDSDSDSDIESRRKPHIAIALNRPYITRLNVSIP